MAPDIERLFQSVFAEIRLLQIDLKDLRWAMTKLRAEQERTQNALYEVKRCLPAQE